MTEITHEALEAAFVRLEGWPAALRESDLRVGALPSDIETIMHAYRTGQLIHAAPSGDEVEAVAMQAVFPILWRQEYFNGINAQDDVDQYRLDGARSMGGRVEGYEVQAREIATAAIARLDAVRGKP